MAGTRSVRSGGFKEMTIRSLAAELGVAPMSLYRHVKDKDDLLTEVVDRMLARVWRPRKRDLGWQAWISDAAERLRNFLVTQPAALHVYLLRPVVSPTSVARMNAMVEVFEGAGMGGDAARRAYAAVHTYTIGFAAFEASRGRCDEVADSSDPLAQQLATYTTRQQFAVGLRYLLDGIERDRALDEVAFPVGADVPG